MSYRNNVHGNYITRNNPAPSNQSFNYNGMISPANNGNSRNVGAQSRNNQLYMGDLDQDWDENTIKQIWSSLGENNVEIKLMWNNQNNTRGHLGYCFVQFPSPTHASNALLKNGMPIPQYPSKTLRLNWASSSNANNAEASKELSVFVGDLAPNVTESQLFELFISNYPSTSHARIVYDQMTGVSKGYAFVKFGNPEDQKRALQEVTGTFLNGRAIRVSSAGHQQKGRSAVTDTKVRTFNGGILSPRPNKRSAPNSSQFMYPTQQQPPLTSITDPYNTTVFVGGLSPLVAEDELRAYFQVFGTIVYVKIPSGKGCGFVQYVERRSAERALANMQGFPIGNSRVRLSWGTSVRQAETMKQASVNDTWEYRPQPSLKQPTYGYAPCIVDTTVYDDGRYGLSEIGTNDPPFSEAIDNTASLLLPGCQNLGYATFPTSASGMQNAFESYTQQKLLQRDLAKPNRFSKDLAPALQSQVIIQSDNLINAKQASLDRIEDGSNGYLFA